MTMALNHSDKVFLDPIEELDETLNHTWRTLCGYYDADGELPDVQSLFSGTDIAISRQAAEIAIANMLMDIVDRIGRFSPWYTKPARVFGLCAVHTMRTQCLRWVLAPEAVQKWEELIVPLAASIRQNSGLIQAMLYVESLTSGERCQDEYVNARCRCLPSHSIKVNRSILEEIEIYCNVCKKPFA